MSDNIDNVDHPETDESIEEAQQMPVGTEDDSVKSVEKAADSGKKAPARKGDNAKQDPMPKTKAGMINAMYGKLTAMKKDELSAAYAKMHEEFGEMEEDEAVELPETSYDFSDELNNLVESEATLSDEFKSKTAIIFETAIRSKISEEVDRLEDEYQSRLEEELDTSRTDMVEKVDSYLNYVVETWMEENRVAVEQGLRTEIAEDFMDKLKGLFVESYIEVPESKVDLVDELAVQVEELEEKLNSQTAAAISMQEKMEQYQRETVIRESASGLAETEIEKLRSLVDSLDFEDEESFSHKVKTVKESYFKKAVSTVSEEIEEDWSADTEITGSSSTMDLYLNAIKKTHKE